MYVIKINGPKYQKLQVSLIKMQYLTNRKQIFQHSNWKNIMSKLQVSWKRQNKELDNDAENNVQLKKEINKESDMDSLVQNSINDKIYDLKQEALLLTKKSENQRYKYLELQTIIKTIKLRMDDQRKIQASSVTDSNFQNIESLERKIKKFQNELEQINSKANKTNSVVSEKKHKISLLRTQRVIDSSIFRNIQKELISTQMEFKKLLIQKIRHQRVYSDSLTQYNSLKAKAQHYFQSQQSHQKPQLTFQQNPDDESYIVVGSSFNNDKNKFKQIEKNPLLRTTVIQSDFRKQEQNNHYEFRVKKFLMNLNLSNGKEFVYNWHNIDEINQKYFNALNKTGDQINNFQEEIKKIQKNIQENTIKFYKPKSDLTKTQKEMLRCLKIRKEVQRTHQSSVEQIEELNKFMGTQNFAQFAKFVNLQDEISAEMDMETLSEVLKSIEARMNRLNFYQAPKLTEQNIIIKTSRTDKQKREQKLEDVMNRVNIDEESDKIMRRQDFKEEYRKMMEAGSTMGSRHLLKKKTKKTTV